MANVKSILKHGLTRRMLIAAFMLTATIALGAPSATGTADFCRDCQLSCENDWMAEYGRCIRGGGTIPDCYHSANNAEDACIALCNYSGCRIPYNNP